MKVKICGVTLVADALAAARLGADAIGLNFWPGSKRCVAVAAAREIAAALPPGVLRVGVFVNQPRDEVLAIAREVGLGAIQLHGDERPGDWDALPVALWRAVRLDGPASLGALAAWPAAAFVVDAAGPGFGGTGTTCDWTLARDAAARAPIWLAGGLTPANVAEAVRAVAPLGVDVASGVESAPGVKDPEKLASFIRRAKESTP